MANAHHVKAVPGRKTDVKDCEWIANLLAHGLIRGSFIPPPPIRDLRDLARHRKSLIRDRVQAANRVHKLLETANIKLANVVADVLAISGRAMLDAEKPIRNVWRRRRAASPESSDLFQEFIKRKPITGAVGPADIAMANDPAQWNVVTLA